MPKKFFGLFVCGSWRYYIYCVVVLAKIINRLANGYLLTLFGGATP